MNEITETRARELMTHWLNCINNRHYQETAGVEIYNLLQLYPQLKDML